MAEVTEHDGRTGLSRRQMIKAGAVAGAAAWTAPAIIDSLASPAAAVSGCTGDKVTLSWIYVLYQVSGSYYITGFNLNANTCGGGGSNPHGTICAACGTNSFTLKTFTGAPPSPGTSVATAEATYTTSGACGGAQSNAWTFVGAPACTNNIFFSNGQITSTGGAVIIGAVGFGAGSLRALCPNNSNPGNSVCGIEL